MEISEMTDKMADGRGFIAALDQSGGSTPKALRGYGIGDDEWDGDEEMFARIHEMRCRIIRSPAFNGDKVVVYLHAWVRLHDATEWTGGRFADAFAFRDGRIVEYLSFAKRPDALAWAGIREGGAVPTG